MKKRITSAVLALSLLLVLLPTTAWAANPTNGTWGNLFWDFDSSTGTLTISGHGDMPDLESYTDSPFSSWRSKVQSIVIEQGVTTIGDSAFWLYDNLSNIKIPEGVVSIGNNAFRSCSKLAQVTIPSGVASIGEWAFSSSGLTSVTIPGSVKSIGRRAFDGCENLKSIEISYGVTSIGEYALEDCVNLSSITIPGSVEFIGKFAFRDCENLKNIEISNGVTSIGDHALAECGNLSSITLPSSLTSIGRYAFSGTGGCNITIPGGIRTIDRYIFGGSWFKSIVLLDGIQVIGDYAFYEYGTLSDITLPNTLTVIGGDAFSGCHSLTKITIPKSVNYIGPYAFYESGLIEADVKGNILMVDDCTFSGCTKLKSIKIPDTVIFIDECAFQSCNQLESINIPKGVRYIGDEAFENCTPLESIDIPEGVTYVGDAAFYGCSNLTNITLPKTLAVTSNGLGAATFRDCDSLTEITIPEGVTYIGPGAFWSCDLLHTVNIPGSVEYIPGDCLSGCPKLTTINYGGPEWLWKRRSGIPDDLTKLGISSTQNVKVNYFPGGKCGEYAYWYYDEANNLLYIENPYGRIINTPTDGSEEGWNAALERSPFIYISEICNYKDDGNYSWNNEVFRNGLTVHTGCYYESWDSDTPNVTIKELTWVSSYPGSKDPKICQITGKGNTEGWECDHCIVPAPLAPQYFERLSHDVGYYRKSATCVDTGLDYGLKCRDCNEVLVEPIVIPATGKHTRGDVIERILLKSKTETESGQMLVVYRCKYCTATIEDIITLYVGSIDPVEIPPTSPDGSIPRFTITFDPNGGTLAAGSEPKKTNYYRLPTLPANPTRSGYKFTGWYTSPTEGIRINTVMEFWADTTVYAHWVEATGNVHSITFDLNDGVGNAIFDVVATGADGRLTELPSPNPVREDYDFGGWFTEREGGDRVIIGTSFNKDTTVYARWTYNGEDPFVPEKFTVTYNFNYDGSSDYTLPFTYILGEKPYKLNPDPTRDGYVFGGWFKEPTCENEWDFDSDDVRGDTILYAKWTPVPKNYKITLDPAGGTLPEGQAKTLTTINDGTLGTMPKEPTRTDYEFINWVTSTGEVIAADFAFGGDTTIYAQWKSTGGGEENQTYTISFDLNYADAPANPAPIPTGADHKLTKPLPTVSREGYTFDGWFTEDMKKVSDDTTFYASITLEAQWTKKPDDTQKTYTITFDPNGGSGGTTLTTGTDGKLAALPNDPTRSGYKFDGWHTEKTGGEQVTTSMIFHGDTTVYARWTEVPGGTEKAYTITFDPNGGSCSTSSLTTGANGTLASLPTPTWSGYTFDGWYTSKTGGERITTSTEFKSDTIVYARWSAISSEPNATEYRIYAPDYVSGGWVYVSHSSATEGTRITIELSPRSGYEVDWVSAVNLNTGRELSLTRRYDDEYTFIMPASSVEVDAAFYERYTGSGNWYIPERIPVSSKPIKWYYNAGQIWHVTDGLVPYGTLLTRDMLISVLYNMDPSSTGEQVFWATEYSIVPDIYASGLWGVDRNISREQAAMILYCYSQHMGYNLSSRTNLTGYTDYSQMRPIARDAMSWVQAAGLFTANSPNSLSPRSLITCGEANTILSRFVSSIK